MEPEKIDKFFKDRLAGYSATPSPETWMRLQQQMAPPKKERTMWVYYVAASIAVILISGLLYFRHNTQKPGDTIAQVVVKTATEKDNYQLPKTEATKEPAVASTSETITPNRTESVPQEIKAAEKETAKNLLQKEPLTRLAQVKTEKSAKKRAMVKQQPVPAEPTEETALALKNKDMIPANKNVNTDLAGNSTAMSVVQVVVKRDNTAEEIAMSDEDTDLRENLARKGNLLKNIYKQARNLKNGEPVELTALGLDTERINAESKNIKQKLTKAISL